MPVPFGVSVGDFIVCAELLKTIIQSLQESQGSSTRFQALTASLKSLEAALDQVQTVQISNSDTQAALCRASLECHASLASFLTRIEKYQPSLKQGGSGSGLKDGFRKVQWALCSKDDIVRFQTEISGHANSILMLLQMVQVSELQAMRLRLDRATTTLGSQIAENRSLQILLCVGLTRCATELRFLLKTIILANVALFHMMLRVARTGSHFSARIGWHEPAVLQDPFGRRFPIATELISSWKTFDFVLRQRLQEDTGSCIMALSGQYVLRSIPSFREVPRDSSFACTIFPGAQLLMSMVTMYDTDLAGVCVECKRPDGGLEETTISCQCGLTYTRAKDHGNQILIRQAHPNLLEEKQNENKSGANRPGNGNPPRTPFGPLENTTQEGDLDEPATYHIGSLKILDFSRPPKVYLTDLVGYTYLVPWRLLKTAPMLELFLRCYTAGGRIFRWPDDYCIVDDSGDELHPDNWISSSYPGVVLKLQLRQGGSCGTLRQQFMSKIKELLAERRTSFRAKGIQGTISEACLLVGAVDLQPEIRRLVSDVVIDQHRQSAHFEPGVQKQAISMTRSHCCLICGQLSHDTASSSRHARSHLMAVHCRSGCAICREGTSEPYEDKDIFKRVKASPGIYVVSSDQ